MTNIALGQTINGSLTSDDSKYADSGYPVDRYDITGLDDYRQLTITVTRDIGKSFEVLLKDATTGELVAAEIDDYGAGKLTLKATTFPGIKYQLEVNGGSDGFFGTVKGGDLGNYTLSIEDSGKATSIVTTDKVQLSRGITGTVGVGTVGADGKFFALASGVGTLTDVALAPTGQFYGINSNILFRIDPSKYLGKQIDYSNGIAALSTIKESTTGFQIGGTIDAIEFANNKLYALDRTTTGDKLYTIDTNPTSGITGGYLATLVGNLPTGFVTSGDDLVYDAANNRFLATASDTSTSDALWQIPLANPAGASKIGQIGLTGLTGLDFENGQLTGFNTKSDGTSNKISINPTTGVGTVSKAISGLSNVSGATTIVGANVTNTTTTPTTTIPTTTTPTPTTTTFPTTPAGAIGTKSQGLAEGRIVDLTDYVSKALKLDITTTGEAAYNNNIGFYTIQDTSGTIKLANGTTLKPGDANYALEAIKSAVLQAGKIDSKSNVDVAGGGLYAPVVVAQGTLADFVAKNPTNGGDGTAIHAYFNYLGANPDKIDHFRLTGPNTFAVEDLYGGGDRDFNDLIVNMNFKTA